MIRHRLVASSFQHDEGVTGVEPFHIGCKRQHPDTVEVSVRPVIADYQRRAFLMDFSAFWKTLSRRRSTVSERRLNFAVIDNPMFNLYHAYGCPFLLRFSSSYIVAERGHLSQGFRGQLRPKKTAYS